MEGSDEIMGTATSKLFTLEARIVPTRSSSHGPQPTVLVPRPTVLNPRSSILDPRSSIHEPRSTSPEPRSPDKARLVPT